MAKPFSKDLMYEILLRLPATSLLRFRCVCKRWRDLIDSRNFAQLHLDYLSNRPPSLLVIQAKRFDKAFGVVDLNSVCNGVSPLALKEFWFPGDREFKYYVGHCNGLVCLTNGSSVLLWNPATRNRYQFELPVEGIMYRGWGFGYDNGSDDCRAVAMAEAPQEDGYVVWIYSLRFRSWKRIDNFPDSIAGSGCAGVFVNGALHWKVLRWGSCISICALHLGKLEYDLVPLPDYDSENIVKEFACFGALDGRLCAMYYGFDNDDFDLWTMREYGAEESWTKLIRCADYTRGLIPLAYLVSHNMLIFTAYSDEMCGYEFRTVAVGRGRSVGRKYETKSRSIGRLLGGYHPYVYTPSLFWPHIGW